MMQASNSIRIERSAWFVFKFMVDFQNSPLFDQFGIKVTQISPGPFGVGTEYNLVHSSFQRSLRVVEFEKDKAFSVSTLEESAPRLDLCIQLVPESDQLTLLRMGWELDTGMPGLVERMLAGKITQAVSDGLFDLRELLETGSVRLGNGYEVHLPNE